MASEPEFMSSALFGADGTALPDPLPVLLDPLTGAEPDGWWDTPDPSCVPAPDAVPAAVAAPPSVRTRR
ncbi:MAG: hypothetical protein ACRD0H_19990 [Actinomycetes bacterium]